MYYASTWIISPTKILSRDEITLVLAELQRKAASSHNARQNLILFRLACCCGLRVSEIAQLRLDDVRTAGAKPHLRIRRQIAKGGHARVVPLWWDAGTLADLAAWKIDLVARGRSANALVLCPRAGAGATARRQTSFSRHTLRKRFKTACKPLGLERLQQLTIHHGRHTFISVALAGQRTLAEVRDAAGHTNVSTTSCYLHIANDDVGSVGRLF